MKQIPVYKFFKHKYGDELLVDIVDYDVMRGPLRKTPVCSYTFYAITLVLDADEAVGVNGRKRHLSRGDIVCAIPGEVWMFSEDIEMQALNLAFEKEFLLWGFNTTQQDEILRSLGATPGRMWHSPGACLLLDRQALVVKPAAPAGEAPQPDTEQQLEIRRTIVGSIGETGPMIAYFDAERLTLPLTLRTPRRGDFFYPLGLGGRKLLSDFMTDQHLSRFQKQAQPLLCHGDDIIWLVGLRSDHRYRVTKETKVIVKIEAHTTGS
ncbi:MAG: tRNA lysidine(34) synthetase TilS [Bacteroidaceae bacterium]|nr:tRNA lysidine(34) synthetase TilS [Bacteroidaceae bacterium]